MEFFFFFSISVGEVSTLDHWHMSCFETFSSATLHHFPVFVADGTAISLSQV